MILAILIAILLAALAYWICALVGLPLVVAVIAAIVVFLIAIGGISGRGRGTPAV